MASTNVVVVAQTGKGFPSTKLTAYYTRYEPSPKQHPDRRPHTRLARATPSSRWTFKWPLSACADRNSLLQYPHVCSHLCPAAITRHRHRPQLAEVVAAVVSSSCTACRLVLSVAWDLGEDGGVWLVYILLDPVLVYTLTLVFQHSTHCITLSQHVIRTAC
jgi:hypothetical protein